MFVHLVRIFAKRVRMRNFQDRMKIFAEKFSGSYENLASESRPVTHLVIREHGYVSDQYFFTIADADLLII